MLGESLRWELGNVDIDVLAICDEQQIAGLGEPCLSHVSLFVETFETCPNIPDCSAKKQCADRRDGFVVACQSALRRTEHL